MGRYPVEKYEIEIRQHPEYLGVETIATSTYAGKPVSGKAICRVEDEYNEELGIKLAVARCAEKIARKRDARAKKMLAQAQADYVQAAKRVGAMSKYHNDAFVELTSAELEIKDILNSL